MFWLLPGGVHAASPTLTKEQIQRLQQLPPAEREALLRTLLDRTPAARVPAPDSAEKPVPPTVAPSPLAVEDWLALQPPRLRPGDTVLIRFQRDKPGPPATPSLPTAEKPALDVYLPDRELFVLDQFGAVTLDKAARIVLKGLNEEEAAARIAAEPLFQGMTVTVKLLPLEEPLKPFGYDLFTAAPGALAPATDIPVPADYVVGPGDTVLVQLFGKENLEHELVITRDGNVLFPGIGPIPVAGLTFAQLEQQIQKRVETQLIGMRAAVTLGRLRTIRVFVLGDVERPGSYAVSGLSTLTNALLASGGVKRIGSLRDIQLKRKGKTVTRMDLYDLLLRGDNSADARLQPGDVIFVPPVGKTVGVAGRVRRPAIYELKSEKTVEELIAMAGGVAPDAFLQGVQLERIVEQRERTLLSLDLTQEGSGGTELRNGDVVRVYSVAERLTRVVRLAGHVHRPGEYQWRPDMRLTDLIPSLADLLPDAEARYVLIKRTDPVTQAISFLDADLTAALTNPHGDVAPALQSQDEVYVFGIQGNREVFIKPLLEQARARSAPDRPAPEVTIRGVVHHPGNYPLSNRMRVSDLLRAAGGLTDRAYTIEAELTRFAIVDGRQREQSRVSVDIAAILQGDAAKDVALNAYDQLVIRRVRQWDEEGFAEILGEVQFPGKYPIGRHEKLSEVIKRAGGPTERAYPRGAIFIRESVRAREQEHLERLVQQLERDLAIVVAQGPEVGVKKETAIAEGQALLRQLRAARAAGRMVIKLDSVLAGEATFDVTLQPGDKLYIPRQPQEITVLGEVYHPTSHLFDNRLSASDYVRLSGGVTERGNRRAIYVVRADGAVSPPNGWFGTHDDLGPGDTVVVPVKVDRVSSLKLFTDISTILFQLAVTAAALDAIGVF